MLTRRALSVLLSLALLFSLLSAPARAADGDYEDDNYSFDASTGTLSIKKTYFDENFQVDDDAVRYVYIASGVGGLPAGGSVFSAFPT